MLLTITYTDRELERLMTRIPNFRPRGYGVFVFNKFEYTAKDCDCRYCLHRKKGIGCTEGKCPYMKERITAGAVPVKEALLEALSTVNHFAFQLRLHHIRESEDTSLALQIRIAEIDAEFAAMLKSISSDSVDTFDESKAKDLMNEKSDLQQQLSQIADTKQKRENAQSRLDDIYTILDGLKNHPMQYDDRIVRQIIECVVVESKEEIKVIFIGGLETTEKLGE